MTNGPQGSDLRAAVTRFFQMFRGTRRLVIGAPRDITDKSIFHHLSLIPFLAWVGLGADGLSSSSYGPEEAFKTLGEHTYLAIAIAVAMVVTVLVISASYSRIIEAFPHGGGGYVVASKLLGRRVGVVSGCALLVDYVLTITVSIAAGGDAIFSFLPPSLHHWKMTFEVLAILGLTVLNMRGVRESVIVLAPVFLIFLVTHAVVIVGGIIMQVPELPATVQAVSHGYSSGAKSLGIGAMLLLLVHAYSLGGGTYTGIEAVSNGLPIMREPRVQTAKRTMFYMATSLAVTASGLLVCYLLWKVTSVEGKTMNAVLVEKMTAGIPGGGIFVVITLLSEGLLLVVAAQAGFIDGPRVLANMAIDSWVPRRFGALSDRLTTGNGIFLMGGASLAALIYTRGDVSRLVVMYSINVFLTFSLSIFGMLRERLSGRVGKHSRSGDVALFGFGFVLCATILVITIVEKFEEGGWITLTVTGLLVFFCFYIKRHYLEVAKKLSRLQASLERVKFVGEKNAHLPLSPVERTAVVLVGGYGGLGIHTVKTIFETFPGVYKNLVFVSIGVVDSGGFKGEDATDKLRDDTESMLKKYLRLGQSFGVATDYRLALGTDIVEEAEKLCLNLTKEFQTITFFTGKIIFEQDLWLHRLLHNETGLSLQKRLQLAGHTMVVLPAKVA